MAQLKEVVNVLKNKQKIIACWAMGLTQHKNAVNTIKEIVNLLLLKGSIGKSVQEPARSGDIVMFRVTALWVFMKSLHGDF